MKTSGVVLDLARGRRSIRKYSKESVDLDNVLYAISTALQAPSSANRQPWRFILRNYQPVLGVLVKVFFEPKEFVVWREEDIKNYTKKEVKRERKFTHLKPGSIVSMEIIEESENVEWYD